MNKWNMDKRKLAIICIAIIIAASLIAYALIQYYGQITTVVPVEQAVWVDGKRFNETITETLESSYGGCTVYANHNLENKGDDDAQVKFTVMNITDSQGNLITDGTVEVSFKVGEQTVTTTIVPGHTTISFEIVIHFHYAITPDTYTITTQVQPYLPL